MEYNSPSDLKTILHSKRANIYYLEHCRVLVNGGRVEYVTEEGNRSLYWNIPIANTTTIILGTGTSLTQSAARELSKAGVLVGFCGGNGTPLFLANETEVECVWFTPQSEYRPTEYLQAWVQIFFDEQLRLTAAKRFQAVRFSQVVKNWNALSSEKEEPFTVNIGELKNLIERTSENISRSSSSGDVLALEATFSKALYRLASAGVSYGSFSRAKRGTGMDPANRFLDHGNYLAYGLGATAAWVLGIPHSLSVLHGKTRRGGLVFDIADLIKDAVVLPNAFIAAMAGDDNQEFRQRCTDAFQKIGALDVMIDSVKEVAQGVK